MLGFNMNNMSWEDCPGILEQIPKADVQLPDTSQPYHYQDESAWQNNFVKHTCLYLETLWSSKMCFPLQRKRFLNR